MNCSIEVHFHMQDYGQLMVGTPKIHDGMEPVAPEIPHDCTAFCEEVRPCKYFRLLLLASYAFRFNRQLTRYQEKNCRHLLIKSQLTAIAKNK